MCSIDLINILGCDHELNDSLVFLHFMDPFLSFRSAFFFAVFFSNDHDLFPFSTVRVSIVAIRFSSFSPVGYPVFGDQKLREGVVL